MNLPAQPAVWFGFLDSIVIVVSLILVIALWGRRLIRARRAEPIGALLVVLGLLLAALGNAAQTIDFSVIGLPFGDSWHVPWAVSRCGFILSVIGIIQAIRSRRSVLTDLASHASELDALRSSGQRNDSKFHYLLNTTSNAVYSYQFSPPLPVNLPIEHQVARSYEARLEMCNPVFARLLGASSPEAVFGQRFGELESAQDTEAHTRWFTAFVKSGYRLIDYELNYKSSEGYDQALRISLSGTVENGRLERIWGVESDILDLRKTKEALQQRRQFESLVAAVSTRLVSAAESDENDAVENGLEAICRFFGTDRAVIFWEASEGDREHYRMSHMWTRGDNPFEDRMGMDLCPKVGEQLLRGEPVVIDDVTELPAEFKVDKAYLQSLGVKSSIAMPILLNGVTVGSLSTGRLRECLPWSKQNVQDFRVFAELFGGFVQRIQARQALAQALNGLKTASARLEAENTYLREEIELTHGFDEIIGESQAVKRCLQLVEQVADTRAPVLLLGETGTGKELLARAIHELSSRRDRPLVKVNCAALPATLIESELFGHAKGAFTGADRDKRGRFDLADGSSLFLDEFGEIPLELQSKLLRVLQEGEYERLGGTETTKVDVRVIAATNRNLEAAVGLGEFRSDLYYRINTFPIELPPLRLRGDDVELLARHFVQLHAQRLGAHVDQISANMMQQLRKYRWPGNVRELEGIIQRALISTSGPVLELAEALVSLNIDAGSPRIISSSIADLKLVEHDHIVSVLDETNWKISGDAGAAFRLGMPASTLRSKMKKLGIVRPGH